jgi:hypothetical protein
MGRRAMGEAVLNRAPEEEARGVYCLVFLAPGRATNAAGATTIPMKTKAIKRSAIQFLSVYDPSHVF